MSESVPREYEIIYRGKERKEDILADIMGLPLQKIKQFGTVNSKWENKLILGDNLQVTKRLLKMKKEGKLQNEDGTDGFRLIYIDPPFATRQEFSGKDKELAYNDKIVGSEFLEFLRKRLILLKELLSDDGTIYVHLDYRKSHYIKIIMDEIFGENNFINEIIWKRRLGQSNTNRKKMGVITDSIFVYSKSEEYIFNPQFTMEGGEQYIKERYTYKTPEGRIYKPDNLGNVGYRPNLIYTYKGYSPPPNGWAVSLEKMKQMDKEGRLHFPTKPGGRLMRRQFLDEWKGKPIQSLWDDIPPINSQAVERMGFPTQKPEKLLKRIIETSSKEGDLILDSFCGSGTMLATAEKLGRSWIGIDSSKFSIYTCQKRMLDLKKEIGNTGKSLKVKPFGVYNAGLYIDGPHLKELDDDEYHNFALDLFQAQPANLVLNGFEMDGILMNSPVHIFPRNGSLTEEFIENLDKEIGPYLKERIFIIVPANRVYFLQDYIEIKGKRYYVLRIPYSIIDELHKKKFVRPWQPTSETDMNQVIDAVGFDFIHPPNIEVEYKKTSKGKLVEELEITIKKFESVQRTKNPIEFKDKESLSMILIDRYYNGDYFNMTDFFFADEIKNNKWKVSFAYDEKSQNIGVVYIDVLGNERIEVKNVDDFRRQKK